MELASRLASSDEDLLRGLVRASVPMGRLRRCHARRSPGAGPVRHSARWRQGCRPRCWRPPSESSCPSSARKPAWPRSPTSPRTSPRTRRYPPVLHPRPQTLTLAPPDRDPRRPVDDRAAPRPDNDRARLRGLLPLVGRPPADPGGHDGGQRQPAAVAIGNDAQRGCRGHQEQGGRAAGEDPTGARGRPGGARRPPGVVAQAAGRPRRRLDVHGAMYTMRAVPHPTRRRPPT